MPKSERRNHRSIDLPLRILAILKPVFCAVLPIPRITNHTERQSHGVFADTTAVKGVRAGTKRTGCGDRAAVFLIVALLHKSPHFLLGLERDCRTIRPIPDPLRRLENRWSSTRARTVAVALIKSFLLCGDATTDSLVAVYGFCGFGAGVSSVFLYWGVATRLVL